MDIISKNLACLRAQMTNDRQTLSMIESVWATQNATHEGGPDEDPEREAMPRDEIASIAELIASILGGANGASEQSARVVVVGAGDEERILRQMQEESLGMDEEDEGPFEIPATDLRPH